MIKDMWQYIDETWEIILLLLLSPGLIILLILSLIKNKVFGLPITDRSEETEYPKPVTVISIIFWIVIIGWMLYDSRFDYIKYYYACPVNESVKCYELKANVESDEGRVIYVTLYFPNGGYLTFDVCRDAEGGKFECDTSKDGESWTFQYSRTEKVAE